MTSFTLDDIEKLLEKQAKAQAAVYDMKREAERSEDFEKYTKVLEKCVDSKVEPIIERQNKYEEKTDKAIAELKNFVKNIVANPSSVPPPPNPYTGASLSDMSDSRCLPSTPTYSSNPSMKPGLFCQNVSDAATVDVIKQRFESGRHTLGFEPIDLQDLDRISRIHGIQDKEHAMKLAVVEYIHGDLNVKNIDTQNIVKVFFQPNVPEENCSRLYAQFDSLSTITTIFQHVYLLRGKMDHHVMNFIPSTHQEQFSYLNRLGFPYRNPRPGQEKCSTRVLYGADNLYLQYKPQSANSWRTVPAPDLPPARLRGNRETISPPAGRQRSYQPNKRAASKSPPNNAPKFARTVSAEVDEIVIGDDAADTNEAEEVCSASSELNSSNTATDVALNCIVPT